MSTFGGRMPEFPDIRVDYFRTVKGVRPPLACFLSHVHSDHLHGLESLKAPFIYCSPATREILIRLERYPHRINFQLGVLESRLQQYKHLKNLLRPIPLETPTTIELAPGNEIQVTLFDANHCTGAVMFLIEGDGKAVLYTGDIRSEPWFVNNLCRKPCLIEYTSALKTLDCIYLDTSFTNRVHFPTKAEGITELLQKIAKYPPETTFHFTAWTYGYEEVWLALARSLQSKIHVDEYKMRIYQSLRGNSHIDNAMAQHLAPEGPALAGFKVGNHIQEGILTLDQDVRIHSCEKGTRCKCNAPNNNTVWIRPIITRLNGEEISEMGVGGGGGDLTGRPELELDSDVVIQQLMTLFLDVASPVKSEVKDMLETALHSNGKALSLDDFNLGHEVNELSLKDLLEILTRSVAQKHEEKNSYMESGGLPNVITFPYSRHASYFELRHLVSAFKPQDVYPCTVDEMRWDEDSSINMLFGDLCTGKQFRHDIEMREAYPILIESSQETQFSNGEHHSQDRLAKVHKMHKVSPTTHQLVGRPSLPISNLTSSLFSPVAQTSDEFELGRDRRGKWRALVPPTEMTMSSTGSVNVRTRDLSATSKSSQSAYEPKSDECIRKVTVPISVENIPVKTGSRGPAGLVFGSTPWNISAPIEISSPESHGVRRKASFEIDRGNKRAKTLTAEFSAHFQPDRSFALTRDVEAQTQLPLVSRSLSSERRASLKEMCESSTYGTDDGASSDPFSEHNNFGFTGDGDDPGEWDSDNGSQLDSWRNTNDDTEDQKQPHEDGTEDESLTVSENHDSIKGSFYFDHEDKIYRCAACHWECWRPNGFCKSCDFETENYHKALDTNQKHASTSRGSVYPEIDLREDSEALYNDNRYGLDDMSAASSNTSDGELNEYEMNSFIDDASVHSAENRQSNLAASDDDSDDDDADFKALYHQKCAEFDILQDEHLEFIDYHDDFRRDILGSDCDSFSDSEDQGFNEIFPVDVKVNDPPVTEMVVSFRGQGDSQGSAISGSRAMARDEAFNAASDIEGQGWHDISLMSTGDNHTGAELEL